MVGPNRPSHGLELGWVEAHAGLTHRREVEALAKIRVTGDEAQEGGVRTGHSQRPRPSWAGLGGSAVIFP